jgi:hypothetical protein
MKKDARRQKELVFQPAPASRSAINHLYRIYRFSS